MSHSEVRRIKTGERGLIDPVEPRELFITGVGTLAQNTLANRRSSQYWVRLRLSEQDAKPIIQQVEDAIAAELATVDEGDKLS